jgi:DTW domain-containing protein YfiP
LLDGTWRQAGDMSRAIESWGRRVSLPMTGESRYWLRTQAGEGKFCTAEALIFLLRELGHGVAHDQLRLQFELHVYAGLCARGAKAKAAEYLADSPVRAAFPELLERLARQRGRSDSKTLPDFPSS